MMFVFQFSDINKKNDTFVGILEDLKNKYTLIEETINILQGLVISGNKNKLASTGLSLDTNKNQADSKPLTSLAKVCCEMHKREFGSDEKEKSDSDSGLSSDLDSNSDELPEKPTKYEPCHIHKDFYKPRTCVYCSRRRSLRHENKTNGYEKNQDDKGD